jgi:hypothetical protein
MRALSITAMFLTSLAACKKSGREAGSKAGEASTSKASEIAALVVDDLASPAFGEQNVAESCIDVGEAATAASGTLVVTATVKPDTDCGKNDFLWVYTREPKAGSWKEAFLGTAPQCWKGVPDEIAEAVATSSGIARCDAPE